MIGVAGCMIRWQGTLTKVGKHALKSWLFAKILSGIISWDTEPQCKNETKVYGVL